MEPTTIADNCACEIYNVFDVNEKKKLILILSSPHSNIAVDTTPLVLAVPTTNQHLLLVLPQPSVLPPRLLSSLSFRLFIVLPPLPQSTPQLLLFISPQTLYSYIRLSEDGLPGVLWFFWWWWWWWRWGGVATAHIITTSTTSCTHKRRSDKENPQFCRHHSNSVSPVGVSM